MEEKTYNDILSNYRKGTEFQLTTNRGNDNVSNLVYLDYVSKNNGEKIVSKFRFMEGGEIFEPEAIGGIEKIVSIELID